LVPSRAGFAFLVKLRYGTSGSAADRPARVDAITDNGGSLVYVSYQYLGLGTFVRADYEQPDVRLDYTAAAAGSPARVPRPSLRPAVPLRLRFRPRVSRPATPTAA
jgi:hypothetical protein